MKSPRIPCFAFSASILLAMGAAQAQPIPAPAQRVAAETARDACKADYGRLCSGVRPGGGRILRCMEAHVAELSPDCRAALVQARQLRSAAPDPAPK